VALDISKTGGRDGVHNGEFLSQRVDLGSSLCIHLGCGILLV